MWYGTVGGGFGVSRDRGRTWRNWTGAQLGAEWQYVTADGLRARGDTVYLATADGLRITWDQGRSWRCIKAVDPVRGGAEPKPDGCTEKLQVLPSEYLLAIEVAPDGAIWLSHLKGVSVSKDQGRSWTAPASRTPVDVRVRAIYVDTLATWLAGENAYFRAKPGAPLERTVPHAPGWPELPGQPRVLANLPGSDAPLIGLSRRTGGT